MRKKDIKLLYILFTLILILIVFVNIFLNLMQTNKKDNNKNNNSYYDQQLTVEYEKKGKYEVYLINDEYNSLKQSEINAIDNFIDELLQKVNEKKYSELYYRMSTDYRNIFFKKESDFKTFMEEKSNNQQYQCYSYKIDNNALYIVLSNDIENVTEKSIEVKVLEYKNLSGANIYFDDVSQIIPAKESEYVSDIFVELKYIVEFEDKVEVVFDLMNMAKKEAVTSINELKLITKTNNKENKAFSNSKVTVKPNEVVQIKVQCDKKNKLHALPEFISYKIDVNGKSQNVESAILYEEEDI